MRHVRLLVIAAALSAVVLITGCGAKKPVVVKSPALESAERLERRGMAAYAKGDHAAAFKDFELAASVYASLAMTDAQAQAELSLARIDADDGRGQQALERIHHVLVWAEKSASLSDSTLLLAYGRASAIYMQQKKNSDADSALGKAERLCANTCEASAALLTMRANWLLAVGELTAAKSKATQALSVAAAASDKANALRSLAQIGFAQNELPSAAHSATEALQLDQTLGASLRVVADLDLLTQIYGKAGDTAKSAEFAKLRDAATAARARLAQK